MTGAATIASRERALACFIEGHEPGASDVQVHGLAAIESVGNAREPWSFTASWTTAAGARTSTKCVMLVKAEAGQLETTMPPEFAMLRAVHGAGVPVARPLWLDANGVAFGRPFFVTEHVPGVADMRVLRAGADDPVAVAFIEHLADAAAALHRVDPARCDTSLVAPTTGTTAAVAQIDHWEPIAERQRLESLPALRYAFGWLRATAPAVDRVAIVHGDLRVGNVLQDGGEVTALLDWEMAHLGDPLEDLAWTYRSLWSPERVVPLDAFIARYESHGDRVDRHRLHWYRMFNEMKHGVISLTAARAFHDGRTSNLRMVDRNLTLAPFLARFFALRAELDDATGAR